MKWLLIAHGLKPNRFSAINGWQLGQEAIDQMMGPYPKRLTAGRIGCILSHLSVIQGAYCQGLETVWIMEDDVSFDQDPHQIDHLLKELSKIDPEWDIFYTDVDSKDPSGNRVPSRGMDVRPDQNVEPLVFYNREIPVTEELTLIGQRFGTYSYVISKRGMKKILDYFDSYFLWSPLDVDIHYVKGLKEYRPNEDIATIWYGGSLSDTTYSEK